MSEDSKGFAVLGGDLMKKSAAILIVLAFLLVLITACSSNNRGDSGGMGGDARFIGIAMPTRYSPRWIDDGNSLVTQLEDLGFRTILKYGDDVVADQVAQINEMIDEGVDILIIAAIDGAALGGALARAAAAGVTIIAYDRLIMDTPHVNYHATFDNFAVGVMQANSLLLGLGINNGATGPFNIELFGGSLDDNNAFFFYDGAMSVLQPLIDDGTLVVRSGQVDMDVVGTFGWSGERARVRMADLLAEFYANVRIDAVLSPYDGISLGIISALRDVGYGTPSMPWPIISGQDATIQSVQSIINGEQVATVFKDTRELAAATVRMVQAITESRPVPVNDTTTYNNNVKVVPSYLLDIVHVDINNWHAVLIGTGYYSENEFTLR